jgi:hypothetical protein
VGLPGTSDDRHTDSTMARPGTVLVSVLVLTLSSSSVAASTAPPASEGPLRLRAYVACGLSKQAAPARECPHNSKVGAFLRANREVSYTICVTYPTQKRLCAHAQEAKAGVPDLVTVTTDLVGLHKVVWTVEGQRLVRYFRRL